jgi:nitroreductase
MVCVLSRRIVAYRDRCFSVQDYAAAIENMLLAIVGLGYESCWVEGHITDADRLGRQMADALGVPAEYELVCYLPVGRAAEGVKRAMKKPFGERAYFNAFGQPQAGL